MSKRSKKDMTFCDISSSDDDFCIESSDCDEVAETSSDSGSEVQHVRQNQLRRFNISSGSEDEGEQQGNQREEENVNFTWRNVVNQDTEGVKIPFTTGTKPVGPQTGHHCQEPIDFFKLFFTDELMNNILEQTNKYGRAKIASKNISAHSTWNTWVDVTKAEISAFLGVVLNMGTIPLPNLKEYWTTARNAKIPYFGEIFRRDRFLQIFWMLHTNQKAASAQDIRTRTEKISNYLQYLDTKFRENFVSGRELSIDEAVVKFKGKISFITYNPKKPTKWGIRIYVLADANTGYVQAILPYYGSLTTETLVRPDLPVSSRIVLDLYQKVLDLHPEVAGHIIFTDRYFTSIPLANALLQKKCYLTGTIQTNRKYIPDVIKKPVFSGNKIVAYRSDEILLLSWKDKRTVTLLSTWDTSATKQINRRMRGGGFLQLEKPVAVINYNNYMGGVDRADQYTASYCFMRKSNKWWRKLFFWGFEMCVINAYIMYKFVQKENNRTPISHLKFVRRLVDQLVGDFRDGSQRNTGPATSTGLERLNGRLHIIRHDDNGNCRDCIVCSNRKIKGGRKQTRFYCDTCLKKPFMCIGNCFQKYHTLENFKM